MAAPRQTGDFLIGMTLTLRPYPTQYVRRSSMRHGRAVTFRPIRPEDEPLMVKFHEGLSEQTVYSRYFTPIKFSQRTTRERLSHVCLQDYERAITLVAESNNPETKNRAIIAVAELIKLQGGDTAEFAITVADHDQHEGLGTELMRLLIEIGRDEKLSRIVGHILPENRTMRSICLKLGFRMSGDKVELEL
jgi:acetyltransferase